jgi:hypothetical protein
LLRCGKTEFSSFGSSLSLACTKSFGKDEHARVLSLDSVDCDGDDESICHDDVSSSPLVDMDSFLLTPRTKALGVHHDRSIKLDRDTLVTALSLLVFGLRLVFGLLFSKIPSRASSKHRAGPDIPGIK